MPYSYGDYKNEVIQHIIEHTSEYSKILDVGPGAGTYGSSLKHLDIEGLEIYPPYIEMFKLEEIYKKIHIGDIRNFDIEPFDVHGNELEVFIDDHEFSFKVISVSNKFKSLIFLRIS